MIKKLQKQIVETFGRQVSTPRDFEALSLAVFDRTHSLISATTLKRLFGYVNEQVQPRLHTLDALAQYIGYKDFQSFANDVKAEPQSRFIIGERICCDDLSIGQWIELTWAPNRRCVVEHRGRGKFIVLEAQNTKLTVGDTFVCHMMMAQQPLFVDELLHSGHPCGAYVMGSNTGIQFSVI